ncbi:MAG: nucleotidyltransferase family protein [Sulfuricurvum sp.]
MKPKNEHPVQKALYDLLIECCQFQCDPIKLELFAAQIDDWNEFLNSAYMHGVFPLVYKALKPLTSLDETVKHHLKSTNLEIASRNMMMTAELLKVIKLLKENGIRTIAIKGPVLSQIVHGDITQRQFSDLDLLVEQSDMYKSLELLSNTGYISQYPIAFLKNNTLLTVGKDFPTTNTKNNVLIEFHWRLFLDRHIKKSNINLFGDSNYRCMINNVSVETLELGALLLYLLLHGSKHYWERAEWIVDIDRLIRRHGEDIDWNALSSMAQEMEIEFMFYLGLAMSYELFDTPLSQAIISHIAVEKNIVKAKEFILLELKSDTIKNLNTGLVSIENLNKILHMKDESNGWLRHYMLTLIQIKELDVYMVNLPNFLSPLYYLVRLYRLFKLNVLRLK